MDEEDLILEVKQKQQYLKNSKYVEIILESEDEGIGNFVSRDNKVKYVPNERKRSVNISEIGSNSNEWSW